MLKIPIKASGLTNLTDARYFAARDVNWLGFCLDIHAANFLRPQELMAIREWVEGPHIVGEFGLQTASEILEIVGLLHLDAIQVGPFWSGSELQPFKDLMVFQELIIDYHTSGTALQQKIEDSAGVVDFFILNFSKNKITLPTLKESGIIDLELLQKLSESFSLWLDLEELNNTVEKVLEQIKPAGLSVQGGAEERVGVKSFDELDDFFEKLEELG